MTYQIYKDGNLINVIVGDIDFIEKYCEDNGYTYSERPEDPKPDPMPTTEERLSALESALLAFMKN